MSRTVCRRCQFQFGCVCGEMDCRLAERDGKPAAEFSWEGHDEDEQVFGRGWAVMEGDQLDGMKPFPQRKRTSFDGAMALMEWSVAMFKAAYPTRKDAVPLCDPERSIPIRLAENVDQVAAVPGVDVVFSASGDLGSFTGWERDDPRYVALIQRVHDRTLKASKLLGGPYAWSDRPGFTFFQGPGEGSLIRSGARLTLTGRSPGRTRDEATSDEPR